MKSVLYLLYILLIIIIIIPKDKLYFTFESTLSKSHIFINNEDLNNRLFYFDADHGDILLDNQIFASIDQIRITPWIFFNQLTLSSISFSPLYHSIVPGKIDSINLTYSLLHPLSVDIHGEGDFGHCTGVVDLVDQKVKLVFEPTMALKRYMLLVSKLHQEKEGLVYESNF